MSCFVICGAKWFWLMSYKFVYSFRFASAMSHILLASVNGVYVHNISCKAVSSNFSSFLVNFISLLDIFCMSWANGIPAILLLRVKNGTVNSCLRLISTRELINSFKSKSGLLVL